MRVSQSTTVICPRCGVSVSTEYKYCPECAFRLRAGIEEESAGTQAPSVWPHVLLLLGALTLIGGFVLAGVFIFGAPDKPIPTPPEPASNRTILTIDDLSQNLVPIEQGIADWQPDRDPMTGEPRTDEFGEVVRLPVYTARMYVARHETSCGQWAEFLTDLDDRAADDPNALRQFDRRVRSLFHPFAPRRDRTGALVDPLDVAGDWSNGVEAALTLMNEELVAAEWAQGYADQWWRATAGHVRERTGVLPERPAGLSVPLSAAHRRMMLAPPHWMRFDPDGELRWTSPEHQNWPVTEIAYTDTEVFAEWIGKRLGMFIFIPRQAEFLQAYHGGATGNRWPWGNLERDDWLNNLGYWPRSEPSLVDVHFLVGPRGGSRSTLSKHGLYHMAGNAREWTQSQELIRHPYEAGGFFYEVEGRIRALAPTMGGSFRLGMDECTVDAVLYTDLRAREMDIGFRIAASKNL